MSLFQKSVTFETGFQEPHFIAVLEVNLVQFQKSVWTFETASDVYGDEKNDMYCRFIVFASF